MNEMGAKLAELTNLEAKLEGVGVLAREEDPYERAS